jgi:hypothetical protein
LAIVIFKDKTAAALCGDLDPFNKIGEASIRVHEPLQQQGCPDPCSKRDAKGFWQRARNASVEQDVLYFVFPNSALTEGRVASGDNKHQGRSERSACITGRAAQAEKRGPAQQPRQSAQIIDATLSSPMTRASVRTSCF